METRPIQKVCIVGTGFMGWQIGLQCAAHGREVWGVDMSQEMREKAAQAQQQELDAWIEEGGIAVGERDAILGRICFCGELEEGAAAADLVIEAVPERLEIKREVFARLDECCPEQAMLATNSSSIRISKIEDATQRPERVLNMHFYGRVRQRPMVELMRGTRTADETVERARQFALSIGMVPLVVRKESTGFIFNRVWRAIKKECLHLVDDGVAAHEDVDRAWMIATGTPLGPFAMMDRVGLDVVRDIEMVYYSESGDEGDAPPRLLLDMIDREELGVKAGKGFYTYPDPAFQKPDWLKGDKS